jgi:mannosyl-oligosaccharide glucosidase
VLELLRDPARLWSPYGLRSLSRDDLWYGKQNAPGDEPYWRGPIWINLNYLALSGLRHYATVAGPSQQRASDIYTELRDNLVGNMLDEWKRTGYFWEQYDPDTGAGKRTHPFNGWSSLALLALAEVY